MKKIKTAKDQSVTVLVAAAGSGARMGGVYKPLEMLCGKPVICYSLELFEKNPRVKSVVIAARKDKTEEIKELCEKYGYTKVKDTVCGGKDRQESVKNAFCAAFQVPEDITKLVAVHDAARPLVTSEELCRVFDTAYTFGASSCACRVRDSVKRTDIADVITEDVDRENLWLMQTPQVFDTDIYHTALSNAQKLGISATDDCAVVTAAGFKVVLCETSSANIKLTYPEDMFLAGAILQKRETGEEMNK